ncbi:hypothetical protein K470DRAFT_259917 [Piedraia hortae CBS 480.64]|uniref:Uncharacterized protein n=1 Tax=Piedraia hortae CBS 480.64 TaxID=1314780 RepID=A0A6A7BUD7_9PEZI|nr:hypothetical protein K470DRAFT_259917 [Piedraia hortae CBS 480.64]
MRLFLLLPALALAEQIPLIDQVKGWFSLSKPSESTTSSEAPEHILSGSGITSLNVHRLTLENYNELLRPQSEPDEFAKPTEGIKEWVIYTTGGNKTCYGRCGHADQSWNDAVPLLSANEALNLGMLDCEDQDTLCNAWMLAPPQLMHMSGDDVRFISVNKTTVTPSEIARLFLEGGYKETEPYQGAFHPWNGFLVKNGLAIPFGKFMTYIAMVPSWAMMLGVSMLSRTFMGRNMRRAGAGQAAARRQNQQIPAAAAAAAAARR